ncbi:MAG: MFS transporter [Actinomycetota bacterium]|nr:MFS transporter [Actinomycetota bacterium]
MTTADAPIARPAPSGVAASTWSPLRRKLFRTLWVAQLCANVGTWMQVVGAQWLLVGEPNATTLVALVQTAISLPLVLLALPSGVLADVFDRRRLLMGAQAYQGAVAAAMAVITLSGEMTPVLLLSMTFALSCGAALMVPAWQAIQPDLVPREQIPSAMALSGVNTNVARAVGPAIAGALVAAAGAGWVFAVNAASFVVAAGLVSRWRQADKPAETPERLVAALWAGGRYVRHSLVVRRVLLRTALFIVPGSALWALLPVVAHGRLGLDASGYGLLLGALGVGAVTGALALGPLRARLPVSASIAGFTVIYAGATLVLGHARAPLLGIAVLVAAGLAWLGVFSTLMAANQIALPGWVRARGAATWMLVFMLGQAIGAVGWGLVGQRFGVPLAMTVAAGLLVLGALTIRLWPLIDDADIDRSPSMHWATPELVFSPDPREGPVVVSLVYRVPPDNAAAFTAAMQRVGRSRRRTGATRWALHRDGADLARFVELYTVPSWSEHLRQHHGRITTADRTFEEAALTCTDGSPVEVSHLFPSGLGSAPDAAPAGP